MGTNGVKARSLRWLAIVNEQTMQWRDSRIQQSGPAFAGVGISALAEIQQVFQRFTSAFDNSLVDFVIR